ncbi:DUF5655 domain-containing protein [Roseibium aggregatum]|uniref:DUF5655 domain-containing protein n=1 Tax=Roseibium aggregatum TaxID=187304 RepID=UPI000A4EF39B|nr:DUF5655 domain-containing protein [Roseibium aggregatum]UFI02140.1 DUF5655 domain-containing protein [Roseibium aggregatum]
MTNSDTQLDPIERYFCNKCGHKTKHFVRAKYSLTDDDFGGAPVWLTKLMLIIECCGCEHLAFVKKTSFSEDTDYEIDPETGEHHEVPVWDEVIFPPVTYRSPPEWFDDLPDATLRDISEEIYKSLQTGSHYLATFGSRTLIDRLIVLTVGDKGTFVRGLNALESEGKISKQEREILAPVVDAGNAAAHRAWAPSKEQLAIILDTVEGLIHRLLVLPKLTEELQEAVPSRDGSKKSDNKKVITTPVNTVSMKEKVEAAPAGLKKIYDEILEQLKALGSDVTVKHQKHYIAFRRHRNFASLQIYNQKKVIRLYLNLDPDEVDLGRKGLRDVRQIGHYGTGDLEVTIEKKDEIGEVLDLIQLSYAGS